MLHEQGFPSARVRGMPTQISIGIALALEVPVHYILRSHTVCDLFLRILRALSRVEQ